MRRVFRRRYSRSNYSVLAKIAQRLAAITFLHSVIKEWSDSGSFIGTMMTIIRREPVTPSVSSTGTPRTMLPNILPPANMRIIVRSGLPSIANDKSASDEDLLNSGLPRTTRSKLLCNPFTVPAREAIVRSNSGQRQQNFASECIAL